MDVKNDEVKYWSQRPRSDAQTPPVLEGALELEILPNAERLGRSTGTTMNYVRLQIDIFVV